MQIERIISILLLVGLTALPAAGLAEEGASAQPGTESTDRALQASLGGQLLFSTADLCSREADVVACIAPPVPLLGFQAGIDHRFQKRWGVGLLGGAHWQIDSSKSVESCDTGTCVTGEDSFVLWRIAAEGRFYPVIGLKLKLWLALECGLAGGVDSHTTFEDGSAVETDSAADLAPEFGLGAGLDLILVKGLFLGFEIRGLLLAFGEPAKKPAQSSVAPTEIGTVFWPLFGLISLGYEWDI